MSPHRAAALAAAAVFGIAIAIGLYVSGSPLEQRLLRSDRQRVDDLRGLASVISRYVMETGRLPETLDALVDGRHLTRLPRDPATREPYVYVVKGPLAFELCADFSRPSPPPMQDDFWRHGPGRACFGFDYTDLPRPNRSTP